VTGADAIPSTLRWFFHCAGLLCATTGCSGNSSNATTTTDAGIDAGAAFACAPGDLTGARTISPVFKSGDAPAPAGGVLTPGRYLLTSMTFYFGTAGIPPSTSTTYRSVLEISGDEQRSTVEVADPKTGDRVDYTIGSVSVAGTTKTTTFRCASGTGVVGNTNREPFTATPSQITTFTPSSTYTLVQELSRL
jgi:hypothetical protein